MWLPPHSKTHQAAALSTILEQTAMFEMGDAVGAFGKDAPPWTCRYQGMNADNLVFDLVKANGKEGTVGSVIADLVERALEDGVIKVEKELTDYKVYGTDDLANVERIRSSRSHGSNNGEPGCCKGSPGCIINTAILQRPH